MNINLISSLNQWQHKIYWRQVAAMVTVASLGGAMWHFGQLQPNSVQAAYCSADLVVPDFKLTNSAGVEKTSFAVNEDIFVKVTFKNQGSVSAQSSDGYTHSRFHADAPEPLPVQTWSGIGVIIKNGIFSANWGKSYASYPGGAYSSYFSMNKSWKMGTAGNYVARTYINFDHGACESNYANNQATINYTVGSVTTPTPTPTPIPTPTPTTTPTPTPAPTSSSYFNLVAESFTLTDSRGFIHPENIFAPNEAIYPKFTLANRGTASSVSGLQTHVYPNKPNTVPAGTASSPLSYIAHGIFGPNTTYSYDSSRLTGAKSFRQAYTGTYYARIFADYANRNPESNESDNQRVTSYKVSSTWPKPAINPTHNLMVANKKYKLSSSFVPSDLVSVGIPYTNNQPLRREAATALKRMRDVAASQGVYMRLLSGYRSYWTQDSLYWSYVNTYGQAAADRFSARAGHSEHQTGLTADLGDMNNTYCDFDNTCFQNTKTGKWLIANAHNYGFIIRYLSGKESITGYYYEPWHVRYVGINTAQTIRNSGKTMEEYYGITGGGY